jgi:hypothetical protein
MTWIEIVDSAVKILGGALIAGVFGYVTVRFTHNRAARAEYAKRRRDLLEKVLEMMGQFDKIYRHQKALFDSLTQPALPAVREEAARRFPVLEEEFRVAFEKFADATAILLMLDEIKAEAALEAYREAVNQWYESAHPNLISMSTQSLTQLRADIIKKRRETMSALAAAYKAL